MSAEPKIGDRVVVFNTKPWKDVKFVAGDVGTIIDASGDSNFFVCFDRLKDDPDYRSIDFWRYRWLVNIGPLDSQPDDWADILVVKL